MAKIRIEGREIGDSCECFKEMGDWYPYCYDKEFDVSIKDIDFDDDEIEEIITDNPDKVAELLLRDKKFFEEVKKYLERKSKRISTNKILNK